MTLKSPLSQTRKAKKEKKTCWNWKRGLVSYVAYCNLFYIVCCICCMCCCINSICSYCYWILVCILSSCSRCICLKCINSSYVSLSFDARATFVSLLLVASKIDVGVGPNPRPCPRPCLSRPITYVYMSSTNSGVDDTIEDGVDVEDSLVCDYIWATKSSSNLAYKEYYGRLIVKMYNENVP